MANVATFLICDMANARFSKFPCYGFSRFAIFDVDTIANSHCFDQPLELPKVLRCSLNLFSSLLRCIGQLWFNKTYKQTHNINKLGFIVYWNCDQAKTHAGSDLPNPYKVYS